MTIGSASSLAAQRATTALPIVFVVGDPVAAGLVKSLAQPGANLTGLAIIAGELNGKRIELLKEAVPSMARLAVLGDANAPSTSSLSGLAAIEIAAGKQSIELLRPVDVRSEADFEAAFSMAVKERCDGIWCCHRRCSAHCDTRLFLAPRLHAVDCSEISERRADVSSKCVLAKGRGLRPRLALYRRLPLRQR